MTKREQNFQNYSEETLTKSFATISQRFAAMAADAGVTVRAFNGPHPTWFAKLPLEQKINVLRSFATYVDVAQEVVLNRESLVSDHRFLWRMLLRLDLIPTADFFSHLEGDEDIIEIYSVPDFVQIYRNISFFHNCSYTLEEILCRPYWELYQRDQSITDAIMLTAEAVTRQKKLSTVHYDLPPHRLVEIDSVHNFSSIVENKFISPLVNSNREIVAVVNVMSGALEGKTDLQLLNLDISAPEVEFE